VAVAYIVQANRNLEPNKIRAGRTIDIPVPLVHENESVTLPETSYGLLVDEDSNMAVVPVSPATQPYVIQSGDSLAQIAQAASVFGRQVSVQDILNVNPKLVSDRIKIGQVIWIPVPPDQARH
jgi:LysM repeat protein